MTKSTFIWGEWFKEDHWGIEFGNEHASLFELFEGIDDAFGRGLDASKFKVTIEATSTEGLGGLKLLENGQITSNTSSGPTLPLDEALTVGEASIKNVLYYTYMTRSMLS